MMSLPPRRNDVLALFGAAVVFVLVPLALWVAIPQVWVIPEIVLETPTADLRDQCLEAARVDDELYISLLINICPEAEDDGVSDEGCSVFTEQEAKPPSDPPITDVLRQELDSPANREAWCVDQCTDLYRERFGLIGAAEQRGEF